MKKYIVKALIVLSGYMLCPFVGGAQPVVLTLDKAIEQAADSSLEAFRMKNMFLSGYWEFRTYQAQRLPSLTMNLTPAQYYRDITRRYDSENDLDVYRKQQSFYAGGSMEVKQNFDLLGGTFVLDSDLGYIRNFGDNTYSQFTSVPVRIGTIRVCWVIIRLSGRARLNH